MIKAICKECQVEFQYAGQSKQRQFCSHSCAVKQQKGFGFNGKHHTKETILAMRLSKLGEKNPLWKGNDVGYGQLHEWVKLRKPKPLLCEECHKKPPYDLASISHKYIRDLSDWQWLCRRCHMVKDGRLKNLWRKSDGKREL